MYVSGKLSHDSSASDRVVINDYQHVLYRTDFRLELARVDFNLGILAVSV